MFEQMTGVLCNFNNDEREAFTNILRLAEQNLGDLRRLDRGYTETMIRELRRVFEIPRTEQDVEAVREQLALKRRDHHVSPGRVICAVDACHERLHADPDDPRRVHAWMLAREAGWKLCWADVEGADSLPSTDLVCPSCAARTGKTK